MIEEYDTSNVKQAAYLQGPHGVIKSLVNNVYYYQDKLGSTTHIADGGGNLLESYRYDLYGTPSYFDSTSQPINSSTAGVSDLYAGERWIDELTLYDLRNRFMSSELGRFLQTDPIGSKGDASNLYRYCHNDPEDFSDPMGLFETPLGGWDVINGGKPASYYIDAYHAQMQSQPAGNTSFALSWHDREEKASGNSSASKQIVNQAKGFPPVDPQAAYRAAQTVVKDAQAAISTSQKTEVGSEVLQTKTGQYFATKLHSGNGISRVDGKMAQNTTISNSDGRFHLVGYVVGYAYYGSRYATRDLRAVARDHNIAATILVFQYNGKMTELPYVKPQPVPIPP